MNKDFRWEILVDSVINQVSVDRNTKKAVISLEDSTTQHWLINFIDVDELMMVQFTLQSIICEIHLWSSCDDEPACRERLYWNLFGKEPLGEEDLYSFHVDNALKKMKEGNNVLLEMELIGGGYITVHAKTIFAETTISIGQT